MIYFGPVFKQSLDGRRASEANGVVQGSDAILVGLLYIGSALDERDNFCPLLFGVGISLAANGG